MSAPRHVLVIALGPVQEFIEQARRTRDLWYGSHLLSEISKAAAHTLCEFAEGGTAGVIFPALEDETDWTPCDEPLRADGAVLLNVSNHVLAVLRAGVEPHAAALTARRAANARLAEAAARVRDKYRETGVLAADIDAIWREQLATHLEFVAAWQPFEDDGEYAHARDEASAALAGRKALREFKPWEHSRAGAPKSSLDGARETVLAEPEASDERQAAARRRLRLSRGEQLDAIGLVKRAGGRPEQFVPLANVALAAWIEEAARRCPRDVERLAAACEREGFEHIHRPKLPWVRTFPFDAHIFLQPRWGALFEELGRTRAAGEAWGATHVTPILKEMPAPFPYVAGLVADGDHMGCTLDAATTPSRHRALSQALARFAARAREVVEGPLALAAGRRGVLVYSGGDDVLAFVCLPDALRCARALSDVFHECLAPVVADGPLPTLSVGLGVGHLMDEMGHLLRVARDAEKHAKGRAGDPGARNALAVVVDKRAGAEARWRGQWPRAPVERLERDVELLRERRLTTGKLYEVRELLRRMPRPRDLPADPQARTAWRALLADDVRRTLRRTEGRGQEHVSDAQLEADFGLTFGDGAYETAHAAVALWIERLRVARSLAAVVLAVREVQEQPA